MSLILYDKHAAITAVTVNAGRLDRARAASSTRPQALAFDPTVDRGAGGDMIF